MSDRIAFVADLERLAENVRDGAERFIALGKRVDDLALDYSAASLVWVDRLLMRARATLPHDSLELYGALAGVYLGEVVRRRSPLPLRWILSRREDPLNPACLTTAAGLHVFPLGKPFKLLETGLKDHGVERWANVTQDLLSREATQL